MAWHRAFVEERACLLRDHRLYRANPTFANPDWRAADLRVLILRLSTFADVERSSGHLALFREVRRGAPGSYVDLAFLPTARDRAAFSAAGVPLILGTQSHRTLEEFDLALVSNACLPELANVPFLLAGSGVPLWSSERGAGWPIVLLGGSNAAGCQALVREDGDCMADALFFGEAEGSLDGMARTARDHLGAPKRDVLEAMARDAPGLWPAGNLDRPARRAVASLAAMRGQADPAPLLPGPEAGTARLEITRGCPGRCAFCFEAHDRQPFRQAPVDELLADALRLKASAGATTLELGSLNFNTHPGIAPLLAGFARPFYRVNPMSQRADLLARTPGLVELELAVDKRSFTLGVEGVSPRLRSFLGKDLDDATLWRCLDLLHRPGVREVKLFFLVTGREEAEDLSAFSGLARELRRRRQRAEGLPRIIFSFGYLVRMPFTPLRYDAFPLDEPSWRRITGPLKSACETNGFEFRLAMGYLDWLFSQILALGDHRLHGLVERLAEREICWDGMLPPSARPLIEAWMGETGFCPGEFATERSTEHPMAFLVGRPSRQQLVRAYQVAKARLGAGVDQRPPDPEGVVDTVDVMHRADQAAEIARAKRRLPPLAVRVTVPPEASGFGPEFLDAWLMRQLFGLRPNLVDRVLSVSESLVGSWCGHRLQTPWHGVTFVEIIAWDPEAASQAAAALGEAAPPGARGGFASLEARLRFPARHFPGARDRLGAWLRAIHAPATVLRDDAGWRLRLTGAWLKRRSLLGASWRDTDAGLQLDLEAGPRLDLPGFIEAMGDRAAARCAELVLTSVSR